MEILVKCDELGPVELTVPNTNTHLSLLFGQEYSIVKFHGFYFLEVAIVLCSYLHTHGFCLSILYFLGNGIHHSLCNFSPFRRLNKPQVSPTSSLL